ncbi:MAG: heptaprenyl diphosphate synthase component II [Candidatus Frackibacter sp. T328-2]|nr:MAG: heptaprenyl diphosphate synthase component II [Candidatus Frackibacter sp. T328-2]
MIKQLNQELESELKSVYNCLQDLLDTSEPFLAEIKDYFIHRKGKLLRPLLTLLCGKLGDKKKQQALIKAAASLEILHMATLVHDDILDKAQLRRGQSTIHRQWDPNIAILFGDFLYAKSLSYLDGLPNNITSILARTIVQMVEGEMQQQRNKFKANLSQDEYLLCIRKKTGSLLATSCKVGAVIGHLNNEDIERMTTYGYYLGTSFQIQDDIIDYKNKPKTTGKTTQNDLQRGIITLPFIYYYQSLPSLQQEELNRILNNQPSEEQIQDIILKINDSNAVDLSLALAEELSQEATKRIESLPKSEYKDYLIKLAKYSFQRNK